MNSSTMSGLRKVRAESENPDLKIAAFKQLDWSLIDKNLLRESPKNQKSLSPNQAIKTQKNSPRNIKWGEILPRLRKSVRKFDPLNSVGHVWP